MKAQTVSCGVLMMTQPAMCGATPLWCPAAAGGMATTQVAGDALPLLHFSLQHWRCVVSPSHLKMTIL
jgi:hypothetical protein